MLVQRIKAETKTASGIFLPESAVKELNEAKVLAVGPGGLDKDGKRVACGVKAGDRVLIPQVCLDFWLCLRVGLVEEVGRGGRIEIRGDRDRRGEEMMELGCRVCNV